MTQESGEPDLLAALGRVDPPPPAVLAAAREVLWSAVAQEMLATGPASGHATDAGQAADAGRSESAPGRRADQPPDSGT